MTIEFKCGQCGQTLRVGDNAAGKRAKCPKCQSVVAIPDLSAASSDAAAVPTPPPPPEPKPEADEWDRLIDSPFANKSTNPYQSPTASKEPPHMPQGDAKSYGNQPVRNVPADFGSIMNYSWAIWKENLGLLIGAMAVVMIVGGAISGVSQVFMGLLARLGLREIVFLAIPLSVLVQISANTFLTVGWIKMILKLARGQRAEFADLFGGGDLFLPALGTVLLFSLATSVGYVLCIIPGIIVLLLWWPCVLLVVDRKASVMESFTMAREVTANNIGTTILVWLAGLGINLLGMAACCIGVVASGPLVATLSVTAYLILPDDVGPSPAQRSISQLI